MKKNAFLVLVLMLLTYSIPSYAGDSLLQRIEISSISSLATLEDFMDNITGIRFSGIIVRIVSLPANIIDSTPVVSYIVNSIIEGGLKFVSKIVDTPLKFLLFTRVANKLYNLEINKKSLENSTFNPSLNTKFLIHGLATKLANSSLFFDIKDRMLQEGDYNVILVDWSDYNDYPYVKASINAVFVGFEIAELVQFLMDSKGISPSSIHLIGHSLGGHVAGFAGKVIPNIGRISGLDAAGPIFLSLPKSLRLSDTDADFVDAIHTNGDTSILKGYGTPDPYGDIDFFPNGGSEQPGCSIGETFMDLNKEPLPVNNFYDTIDCNHHRVLFLYLESIDVCQFDSVQCSDYQDFEDKKCPQESSEVMRMGFHAKPSTSLPTYSKFYLKTTNKSPFCFQR